MRCMYTTECYSAIKKDEMVPFAAPGIELEIIILSEVGQKEKDKDNTMSLLCSI